MQKAPIILIICFLWSNMLFPQGTVIYKNTFAGATGSSPAATTPEINLIQGFIHESNQGMTLDGNGNIIWREGEIPNFGSYKFRLDLTPLNQNPALTGIKATVVMRVPSDKWTALGYGNYQTTINPTAFNGNTWFLAAPSSFQIFGGEGTANAGTVGNNAHSANDTISVEYIYHFDKTVTLVSNGDTIVKGLSKPHTGANADPSILWCMLTFQNQSGITDANQRGFFSELTIETLGSEKVTRHIDLSVDQTGWEDCITTVRNDFSEQQIKVFPNPSDGVFEMNVAGFSFGQSLNLKVVDSQGRIIQTRDKRLWGEGLHNFRIDLSGQSAGIYYIILMDRTNKVYSCKIIKN